MFKKCFVNILYINVFTESINKITQEAWFDWKRCLNIDKIAEEMKVMLEMFLKHLQGSVF